MNADDVLALRRLADLYADAVDRRDAAALAEVFAPDGRLVVQPDGAPVQSEWTGAHITGILEPLHRYDSTFHHVGGSVLEEDGDGATGRVHLTAHHYERTGNGPVDLVMFIVYHDRYTRGPGGWRIQDRRVAVQWTELHPAHPAKRPGS
ncbi:MAG TPA: nuclear transport factor 2 family protein [Acidimicrobiales bacterium]|nr:nuclear transport factor 2 family protein [Acidimicrobiales bacterium]